MSHTFQTGALVVNLIEGSAHAPLGAGRVYRVVGSVDGHAGAGHAQEWVRVADDRGVVIGFDPVRFIAADPERRANPLALMTALKLRADLKTLLKGIPKDGVLSDLYTALQAQADGLTEVIAATALDPNPQQIIFNEAKETPYNYKATVWEVGASGLPFATLTGRSDFDGNLPTYDLSFAGGLHSLKATNFDEARQAVIQLLESNRLGRDFDLWASALWMETVKA